MNCEPTVLDERARHIVCDIDRDDGERLLALTKLLPPEHASRFSGAARRAGRALEMLKPAILGHTDSGMVAGCYSEVGPGHVLLLVADAKLATASVVPAGDLDRLADDTERQIKNAIKAGEINGQRGGLLTTSAIVTLDKWGIGDANDGSRPGGAMYPFLIGLMLDNPEQRQMLSEVASDGAAVPAIVVLVSKKRDGTISLPLMHGRAFPVVALSDSAGSA